MVGARGTKQTLHLRTEVVVAPVVALLLDKVQQEDWVSIRRLGRWVDKIFLIRKTLPSNNHLLKLHRFNLSIGNSQDAYE